jgi:hypothetical protein
MTLLRRSWDGREMMKTEIMTLLVCASGLACGIKTNQVTIGQKTSLEMQLMGEVEPLSEEELLVSSVRAAGGATVGSPEDLQVRAIAARRRQLFNRDDVDDLKQRGCLAEGRRAELVARQCTGELENLRDRLLRQENADRGTIIDWAVAADPVLTTSDRAQVVQIYGRLLRARARPGDWLQEDSGTWRQR